MYIATNLTGQQICLRDEVVNACGEKKKAVILPAHGGMNIPDIFIVEVKGIPNVSFVEGEDETLETMEEISEEFLNAQPVDTTIDS
jgi:hypothetical protein